MMKLNLFIPLYFPNISHRGQVHIVHGPDLSKRPRPKFVPACDRSKPGGLKTVHAPELSKSGGPEIVHGPDLSKPALPEESLRHRHGDNELTCAVARYGALGRDDAELAHRTRIAARQPHGIHLRWGPERHFEPEPTAFRWGANTMWPPPKLLDMRVILHNVTQAQFDVMEEEIRRHGTELKYLHLAMQGCYTDDAVFTRVPLLPTPASPAPLLRACKVASKLETLSVDLCDAEFIQDTEVCSEVLGALARSLQYLARLRQLRLNLDHNNATPEAFTHLFERACKLTTLEELCVSLTGSHGFGEDNVALRQAWRSLTKLSSLQRLRICVNDFRADQMQISDAVIGELCEAAQQLPELKKLRVEFGESECTFTSLATVLALASKLPLTALHVCDYRYPVQGGHPPAAVDTQTAWRAAPPLALERLTLEVKGNHYSMQNMKDLFEWIESAQHLKSLTLDISSIVEVGANNSLSRYIFRRLGTLTLLHTLEIRTNTNVLMDDTVIMVLDDALRQMPWLTTLRLEMDDSCCTAAALEQLFDTVANELRDMNKLYVQARGCEKIDEETVRRLLAFYFDHTNVAATVVLGLPHWETYLTS